MEPPARPVSGLTPAQRTLRARLAAHCLHGQRDSREITSAARRAFLGKFEQEVDPEGVLPPAERARRAQHLLKAHMVGLALARATKRARKDRTAGNQPAVQVEEAGHDGTLRP